MERNDPLNVRFLAGAIASSTAELMTLPLDCSKVRMQTHGMSNIKGAVQFNGGLFDTLTKVIRHEGVFSLWNGARPAVVRQVAFYSVSMVLYAPLRDSSICETGYLKKVVAGGISGGIGIALANPLDVIKVKMQNDRSGAKIFKGIGDAFRQIYAKEGARGFLRGIWPNIQRCCIVNGMEFGTYDQCKTTLVKADIVSDGIGATVGASLIAGFAGAVASSPLDVIKTRLMAEQTLGHHYNGVWDCAIQIHRQEGIRAFYKGFTAYYLREAPWCCIFFITYELARNAIAK